MSTDYLAPTTELEAVNEILAAIGEAPVGTLQGALPIDASTALKRLRSRSRGLQASGWSFNTDYAYTLPKNAQGKVPLPVNALMVDPVDDLDIVPRGQFLYDRVNHTFVLNKDVTVDIVRFLPWEDLPEYARQFLFISTSRTFADRMLGDEALHQYTADDEKLAWANFLDAEARNADLNILRDSWSAARVIKRRPM